MTTFTNSDCYSYLQTYRLVPSVVSPSPPEYITESGVVESEYPLELVHPEAVAPQGEPFSVVTPPVNVSVFIIVPLLNVPIEQVISAFVIFAPAMVPCI